MEEPKERSSAKQTMVEAALAELNITSGFLKDYADKIRDGTYLNDLALKEEAIIFLTRQGV